MVDLDEGTSSSAFDSWIPLKIGFPSKFSKAECFFATVSLTIYKFLTLITLFYSLMKTLKIVY